MHKKDQAIEKLLEQKLLPLYYHPDVVVSLDILEALYEGGIRVVEYTNRGREALKNFWELKKTVQREMTDLYLGIGTIKTAEQAADFIEAGADFIVCPSMNEDVAIECENADISWIPGCMTPTEIAAAENAGATLVKIFPGNLLGPSYISSIKDLFPGMRFMPTGGVESEEANLRSWFSAGVVAVGMGSKLISKEMMEKKQFSELAEAAKNTLNLIRKASA